MTDKRNEDGTFAPGNSGGPGRPRRATERQYLEVINQELSLPKWKKIVTRAIADAIKGDYRAREWLSNYTIGKPPTIIELKATEAQVLRDVLALMESHGVSASDLFNSMLVQLSAVEHEPDELD